MSRVLMVCHGHPDLNVGGGEIAAYRQCCALRAAGHEVLFLARSPHPTPHCGTPFSQAGTHPHDVLFHPPDIDHFLHSQRAKWAVYKQFRALLERFAPTVFHFHHYVHLGVELLREARRYAPAAPIVLTLHEYLAICHNHGQMVKAEPHRLAPPQAESSGAAPVTTGWPVRAGEHRLCERSSPAACSACFPNNSPQDFFLRESYLRSFLDLADAYICPSRFLLERYERWGLPREKLHVIDNGQPPAIRSVDPAPEPATHLARRFAMFGQISELKGAFVFLDAVRALPARLRREMVFEIYGTTRHQNEAFRQSFADQLHRLGGAVRYFGEYRPDDVAGLMRRIGWVVVPSIWWENSPLVIQEAFNYRRPVICSNIGGMAEKVTHGRDGLHFVAGSAFDLAARMEQAAGEGLWAALQSGITAPFSTADALESHLELYNRIAASRTAGPPVLVTPPSVIAVPRTRRTTERRATR